MTSEAHTPQRSFSGPGLILGGLLLMIIAVIAWRIPHLLRAIEEKKNLGPEIGRAHV